MTFWQIFRHVFHRRPIPALGALYWHVTGRKVRARNRLRKISSALPFGYDLWIATVERNPELARSAPDAIVSWSWKPKFLIVLYGYLEEGTHRSRQSVQKQFYPFWTLIECNKEAPAIQAAASDADYVIPLHYGDELSEAALFRLAELLNQNRSASILYADHDELDARGKRVRPWFKPQWNPEMFLALDYLSQAVAIETGLARRTGILTGELTHTQLSEALLQGVGLSEVRVLHLPHVLTHVSPSRTLPDQHKRVEMVARHLAPFGAACTPGPFGTSKVSWPLPSDLPKVSIIIPTRDKVELLRACVDSLRGMTSYPSYEIIIVDNGSVARETLTYLDQISNDAARVLIYDQPYNFSAINNFAVGHAKGTFVCFLNNDTEIVEPNWLTEMMRYAVRGDVGAVGAKLLYPDGTIQHAGIVVGLGDAAGHQHRFTPADQPGYFRQPHVSQSVTAVTAACLVVEKQKFEAVGGFDENELAIAYNDVDCCLKLHAAGFRNIYVPHAELVHHESKSRESDLSPEQLQRYMRELQVLQDRWATKTFQDPLHNSNLDRYSETFSLRV